jgi:1-acyl-sn-glycerol-3-phosphate acyltransferase
MDEWKYQPAGDQGLRAEASFRSLRREAGLVAAVTQAAWRVAVRAYLLGYHRLRIEGAGHIPAKPPFVMIANHSSHLDVLALGAALPWRLRRFAFPIAAGDVFFETPAVSAFSAMMLNALPMWRKKCGSHAMQELRERLTGEPAIYLLFPEGKRSRDGSMSPFKPGLGMMIAGTPVPVVPCWIEGAFHAFRSETRLPLPKPIGLRIGAPLVFADVENARAGWQEIAARLEAAVVALRDGGVVG